MLSEYSKFGAEHKPRGNIKSAAEMLVTNVDEARPASKNKSEKPYDQGSGKRIKQKNYINPIRNSDDDDTFLSSYLDQFLGAIKIFGYLEKQVFHDLTKNMKTQKLDEGEILLLDDTIGLAIVVEGSLNIYHEVEDVTNNETSFQKNQSNNSLVDRNRNATELNIINGSTDAHLSLNSLHSSPKERLTSKDSQGFNSDYYFSEQDSNITSSDDSDVDGASISDFDEDKSLSYIRLINGMGKFQMLNTVEPGNPITSLVNILNLFTSSNRQSYMGEDTSPISPDNNYFSNGLDHLRSKHQKSLHNGIPKVLARANTDSTIAIIPPQSFAKLTAKYPRSASNIIQMILTKLYHVTFQTAYSYLGLTKEIFEIEIALNKRNKFEIPYYLKQAVIRSLNESGNRNSEMERLSTKLKSRNSESNKDHQSSLQRDFKRSNEGLGNGSLDQKSLAKSAQGTGSEVRAKSSRHVFLHSRDQYNPGDLLSNVPLSRLELANSSVLAKGSNHGSHVAQKDDSHSSKCSLEKTRANNNAMGISGSLLSDMNMNFNSKDSVYESENDHSAPVSAHSHLSQNVAGYPHRNNHSMNNPIEIKPTIFSAEEEETEETAVRMALGEAILNLLAGNDFSLSSTTNMHQMANHLKGENKFDSNDDNLRSIPSSDVSIASSAYPTSRIPSTNLRILPSEFAVVSRKNHRYSSTKKGRKKLPKKRKLYHEDIPPGIDMESAKMEFAESVELKHYKKDTIIVKEGSKGKGLFYVISGSIDVTTSEDNGNQVLGSLSKNLRSTSRLFTVNVGGIAGYLSSLVGYKSFVNLIAKTDVYVGFLPVHTLEKLCDKYFFIYLRIAETLTTLLPPKLLKLDHALEWVHLNASETLFRQDDPANGIYVVLNGRLRQLQTPSSPNERNKHDTEPEIIGELAQGESFGEVEVLTAVNRFSSIIAVRDSELARIPRTLFELLALEHPSVMIRVSRLVARKIIGTSVQTGSTAQLLATNGLNKGMGLAVPSSRTHVNSYSHSQNNSSGTFTFRTIAILPVTAGLPVESFAMRLVQAFKQVGRNTIGLDQSTTLSYLGRHAFDKMAKLKQRGYFAELEEMYDTVVYIGDTPVSSNWTKTCIAQSDCILFLADALGDPSIGEYENLLLKSRNTARTELIMLHNERLVEPGVTHKWLKVRPWIHSHHHIQFSPNAIMAQGSSKSLVLHEGPLSVLDKLKQNEFSKKAQHNISRLLPYSVKTRVEILSSKLSKKSTKYYTPVHAHKNDFLRLARILSGQAVGLVLGGGGARGLSHLGILQAIEDQGIPIDMVGGTSIGSLVGGLYARDYDLVPIYGRLKSFAGRISSIWRMLTDLTWPVMSYTTGHEFNRGIWKTFGDTRIEDFWIQYYCNSTNITDSVQEIHSYGYAWRYIRASMSLAGLLPPLVENGSMLLDGGYIDNLPVGEMKSRGCQTIFAVDVGSVDDRTPMEYGDSLNGFWVIFNRWNPFSKHPNVPNMAEVQTRLGYVASVNALEQAKNTPGVIYVRPPIENYATLDFGKFKEIYNVGVVYGRVFLQELISDKRMPTIPGTSSCTSDMLQDGFITHRRNSI